MARRAARDRRSRDFRSAEMPRSGSDPVMRTRYRSAPAGAAALGALGSPPRTCGKLRAGAPSTAVDCARRRVAPERALPPHRRKPPPFCGSLSASTRARRLDQHPLQLRQSPRRGTRVLGTGEDRAAPSRRAAPGTPRPRGRDPRERGLRRMSSGRSRSGHASSAQAVALQPLLEIERIGDAPPEPLPPAARPLGGVRVLDLTRVLAGRPARAASPSTVPTCSRSARAPRRLGLVELDTGSASCPPASTCARRGRGTAPRSGRDADVFSQSYRRRARRAWVLAAVSRRASSGHRLRIAQRMGRHRSVARPPRLRQHRADGEPAWRSLRARVASRSSCRYRRSIT